MGEASGAPIFRVPVADSSGDPGFDELFELHQVLYAFRGSAMGKRIQAPWLNGAELQPGRVYVRTVCGVHATRFRSLAALHETLPGDLFLLANPATLVNLGRIVWVPRGREKWLGFLTGPDRKKLGDRDWVRVTALRLREIRTRLGL